MEKYLDAAGLKTYTSIVKEQIGKSCQAVLDTKAQPDGIASLDSSGNVPLSQLGNVDNTLYEIVTALPSNLAATSTLHNRENHIFILARAAADGTSQNAYKEYIYTGPLDAKGNVQDITKWEELGEFTSDVDLKGYSKKVETIAAVEIIEASSSTNTNAATVRLTLADGTQKTVSIPTAAKSGSTYLNGLMLGSDKEKLDKIDVDALLASINNANTAADNANTAADNANAAADNANAAAASVEGFTDKLDRLHDSIGPYTDRDSITLTALQTNKAISADGTLVNKSGWAIAQFTAALGNEYLFKPGETSSDVCVFAEKVDKVETRAIDYQYTYGTDGKVSSATATYNGKTYTYTYTYAADGTSTITDQQGSVVASLPTVYTTTVGSYQPMTRLNADAELPEDGYCRFVSNFQSASSITVVASYKVGSADLTMRVLRDGMTASMCTQLSKINQKVDTITAKVPKMWMRILSVKDTYVTINGKETFLQAHKNYRFDDVTSFSPAVAYKSDHPSCLTHLDIHYNEVSVPIYGFTLTTGWMYFVDGTRGYEGCPSLTSLDVSAWDTSKVTNMGYLFGGCSSLTELDVSGWDTSKVTNMIWMFNSCSSLTTLDVSGWDVSKVTDMHDMFYCCPSLTSLDVSAWDTSKVTNMGYLFGGCSSLTELDVSGWDTSKVTNMIWMFNSCSSLTTLDVSGWDVSKVTDMQNMFWNCSSLQNLIVGEGFGKAEAALTVWLVDLASAKDYKLTDETYASFLTLYDRATAGLPVMTLQFSKKHNLPDGFVDALTAKGYAVTQS